MHFSDPGLLTAFDSAGLSEPQRALVGRVLQALDDGALFTQHVTSANSAILALIRAHAVLASHAADNQPYPALLKSIVLSARASVAQARDSFRVGGGHTALAAADAVLAQAATDLTTHLAVNRGRRMPPLPGAGSLAASLNSHIAPVEAAVRGPWIDALWSNPPADPDVRAAMHAETAALAALRGRDAERLLIDLRPLLQRGPVAGAHIAGALWPPHQRRALTLLVQGARELDHLETLLPGARQWAVINQRPVGADKPSKTLEDFTKKLGPLRSHTLLIEFPVEAADVRTTVVTGRRELSEALDQYAAGERLVELSIGDPWAVRSPDGTTTRGVSVSPTARRIYPLTRHQPYQLRPAMRAVSLARRVDAPMTSAALCWSALESTGLAQSEAELLAKACALQSLRLELVSLHTVVLSGARARLKANRITAETAQRRVKGYESAQADAGSGTTPAAVQAAQRNARLADQARRQADHEGAAYAAALREQQDQESRLRAQVPVLSGRNQKEYLPDVAPWLDVLKPARPADPQLLTDARTALDGLARTAGGTVRDELRLWQRRLSDPAGLARHLEKRAEVFTGTLHWLYATRNLAFHKGQFAGPADELSAHAGRAMVDMTLEFLGNWRSLEHAAGRSPAEAPDVYRELANRYTELRQRLGAAAATCHPLRIDHLTGPQASWWT